MDTVPSVQSEVNLRLFRDRLAGLFGPKPAVYWADMLGSAVVGWGGFVAALALPPFSALHLGLCAMSALALYRGAMFIHELTHLPKGALRGFHSAWDSLFGVPLQIPSFMYLGVHLDHHRRTVYGTSGDPEYLPLARGARWRIAWFVVGSLFVPLLLLVRFAVLAPLSLVFRGRLRTLVEERASSLVINPAYKRPPPSESMRRRWMATEVAASVLSMSVIGATVLGWLAPAVLVQWLAISAAVAAINQLRTLGAHRWRNDGGAMDVPSQFFDSINTPHPLGALWAPVGLRFHALHHFVPDLPYHALGAAHRRLVADLPREAGYERTVSAGMFTSLATVWREAKAASGRARDRNLPALRGTAGRRGARASPERSAGPPALSG